MTWIEILLLVVFLLAFAFWWSGRPTRHRNVEMSDFERYFAAWIPTLGNGGLLFVREEKSKHFIQFAIYRSETDPTDSVIQFALPDAEWSKNLFEPVHIALKKAGFDTKLESTDSQIKRFLVCDLPGSRDSTAHDIAELARVALAAMGHDATTKFTLWADGDWVNPWKSTKIQPNLEH